MFYEGISSKNRERKGKRNCKFQAVLDSCINTTLISHNKTTIRTQTAANFIIVYLKKKKKTPDIYFPLGKHPINR
jgi:hypothetical protein